MKKYLIGVSFLITLGLLIVFSIVNGQVSYSKDIIVKFTETLKEKNPDSLIPFLTNEPEYVSKKSFEEFRKIYKLPEKKTNDSNLQIEDNTNGAAPGSRQFSGKELVEEIVPINIFFDQNRYLKEVVSFKETDKEARAKVKFGGWDSQTGEQFGDVEYDILLYRGKEGWKIFKIKLPNQNEKYDIYKFYALSNNHR